METVILWISLAFGIAVAVILLASDLRFLASPCRRVEAVVEGHQRHHDDGTIVHAALFGFTDPLGNHRTVADGLLDRARKPAVGTRVTLVHPEMRPDLARVPRPWLRATIYLALAYLLAVLIARLAGWIS